MTKAQEFLTKYNQDATNIDVDKSLELLEKDILAGLAGQKSSLEMIPSYLTADFDVQSGKSVVVIDAGGTNFRSATATFDKDNNCVVENLTKTLMPGVGRELSKEKFYAKIAYNVRHQLDKGGDVGFCFSYSVNMDESIDGTINSMSKETKCPEIIGTKVGQCTLEAMKKYSSTLRKIAILNDTVATLLGGKGSTLNSNYSSYVGYIYGTGTNISYVERNSNILKKPNLDQSKTMVINTECGSFDKFARGIFDEIVDDNSTRPHEQCAEKMTSGRYLSQVVVQALLQGIKDGIFGGTVVFPHNKIIDTACISEFLSESENKSNLLTRSFYSEEDRQLVREIALRLVERAAKIGAIMNSAFMIKCGSGVVASAPIALVAEGTTFYKLYSYREQFSKYLDEILTPRGIHYEIVSGKDLNLVGTAMAALTLN